ncbi:unnamed protein product [Leuciscus chuanchicus]
MPLQQQLTITTAGVVQTEERGSGSTKWTLSTEVRDSATSLLDNTIDDDTLSTIDSLALSPCSDASTSQLVIAASPPARPSTPATSSSTSRTPERVVPGKRKRSMHHQEHLAVLREMQVADIQQQELNRAQRELHLQMAIDEGGKCTNGCIQSSLSQRHGDACTGDE